MPRQITVGVNDTITWTNNDTEAHTVTSGNGAGIESLMNTKEERQMEYLIAGRSSLDSRGHIRLLIHPWMDGVIAVQGKAQNIPNYPVYASGARISNLPVYNFTPDGKLETGLSWDPHVLLTGKEISFFVTFFD